MTEEGSDERFKKLQLAFLQDEEKKREMARQQIHDKGKENVEVLKTYFGDISKLLGEISSELTLKSDSLTKYYLDWLKRRMSEVNSLYEQQKNEIQSFQTDLNLLLNGLRTPDKVYVSPFAKLKEITEQLKGLTSFTNALLDSEYFNHLLKEISKFGIPGVAIEPDENCEYILSLEVRQFLKEADKTDLTRLLTDVKVGTTGKVVEKISSYMKDSKHAINLSSLGKDLSDADKILKSRAKKGLYWCNDPTKSCFLICPGFSQNETYCEAKKTSPYDSRRLYLISRVLTEAYSTVRKALEVETKLREIKKQNE